MFLLLALHLSASANSVGANIPDFRGMMNKLIENRHTYNRYNDSIFLIHNRSKWVDFFFRRSTKNREIYRDNEKILNQLYGYFDQPSENIPAAAYDSLYKACQNYLGHSTADPFITQRLCNVLLDHYQGKEGEMKKTSRPCIWLSNAYYAIYQMTKDKDKLAKAYELIKYAADSTNVHSLEDVGLRGYALEMLTSPTWFLNKLQTLDEFKATYQHLRLLTDDSILDTIKIPKPTIANWKVKATKEDENIVRNFYLADENSVGKAYGDSVLNVLIQRMDRDTTLNCRSKLRLLIMKVRAQCITTREALRQAMALYANERRKLDKTEFEDVTLNEYMQHFTNLTYLNDIADIPEKQKHKNALFFCNDISKIYRKRKDQQASTNYIKNLVLFTTYPRLINHLSEQERIHFLQTLIANTQVTTYAHSVHVAKLAETLTDGIIDHAPHLFVGQLGCETVQEVCKNRQNIKHFLHRAALFHDLGKNDMVSVVSNDYRPLSAEEREIIKTHPRLGLKYLDTTPSLAPFHDTTLGHHKWYNGKGGYPEDFDNTQSRKRLLIDIVTLCDCIQAATEKLGRNYKQAKSFETVMIELRQDAGIRYNPDLIKLIDSHEDVTTSMKKVAIDGWLDIYYDIHKRYFK